VEIKDARWKTIVTDELANKRAVSNEGRKAMALTRWTDLNPDLLKYQMIYADPVLLTDDLDQAKAFVTEEP
jgi:hypothetical protein